MGNLKEPKDTCFPKSFGAIRHIAPVVERGTKTGAAFREKLNIAVARSCRRRAIIEVTEQYYPSPRHRRVLGKQVSRDVSPGRSTGLEQDDFVDDPLSVV